MKDKEAIKLQMSLVLTERDIRLFRYLNEQKYMVLRQIQHFFWPGRDLRAGAARRRIQKLVEAGYIKTLKPRDRRPLLFLLTDQGIEVLRGMKLDHGLSEIKRVDPLFMEHTLRLVNLRALFEEMGQKDWKSERLIRREGQYLGCYPDAILTVHGFKVAIEFENSIRETQRYVRRFRYYQMEREFNLVIYVMASPRGINRLFDLDYPQDKVCFVTYEDLLQKKGDAELGNASSKIKLGSLL